MMGTRQRAGLVHTKKMKGKLPGVVEKPFSPKVSPYGTSQSFVVWHTRGVSYAELYYGSGVTKSAAIR